MKRGTRIALILVAVVSFGIALSYPILYERAAKKNNDTMEDLSRMRAEVLNEEAAADTHSGTDTEENNNGGDLADLPADRPENAEYHGVDSGDPEDEASESDTPEADEDRTGGSSRDDETSDVDESDAGDDDESEDGISSSGKASGSASSDENDSSESDKTSDKTSEEPEEKSSGKSSGKTSDKDTSGEDEEEEPEEEAYESVISDFLLDYVPGMKWRQITIPEYEEYDAPMLLGRRKATNRNQREGATPYNLKKKIKLDEKKILPELKAIYEMNNDLIGWLVIEDTQIDYPVVQRQRDNEFYLHHDFFGEDNDNGQIILDSKCDPYTPSYNLVISGHHMRNGSMFGSMDAFKQQSYWETHKLVTFDTLMRRGTYVIFAAFYSADYDEYEEGFRYNADLQYKIDVDMWLDEVYENSIYDTDIEAEFGDEFITLTTCDHTRRDDGRFVLICRRVREGEVFR